MASLWYNRTMSIAMFMSPERLAQEHGMLNRLAIGLINEGEQVTRVIPHFANDVSPEYEKAVSIISKLHTQMRIPWLQRKEKHSMLAEALQKSNTESIVVFGKSASPIGTTIARLLDVPLYQEVTNMRQAKRVRRSSSTSRWLAATPSIERAVTERVGEDRSALMPLGVATVPKQSHDAEPQTRCVIVLNASDEVKETRSVLLALQPVPDTHVFLECNGRRDQHIWSAIKESSMHNRVTCLKDVASLRKLVIQADLIILPSSRMSVRTVLLEAMESGVPVISTIIPGFDMLVDGETAILVNRTWAQPLRSLIEDKDLRLRLGMGAEKLISRNYGSAVQIAALQAAVTPF